MAYGLTSAGYTAPRTADFLAVIRNSFEAAVGVSIDWSKNAFLYHITSIMAQQLGELGDGSQMVYDAWVRANASGLPLDDLGNIVGIPRIQATQSTADYSVAGDATSAGKIVPAGTVFEGGDPANPVARWTLDVDVTLTGAAVVATTITAVDHGEVTAAPGTITTIVTPVSGLASVANAAAASAGVPLELDADYRLRQQSSLQITGGRGLNAIAANLTALDGIIAAGVIDNVEAYAQTIEGVAMDPHSIAITIAPNTLTIAQQQAAAQLIYDQIASATKTMGDKPFTVTGADGYAKPINYFYAADVNVTVVYTITLQTGYTLSQVAATILLANAAYFDLLAVGEDVLFHKIVAAGAGVAGVETLTVTANGAGINIPISSNELGILLSQVVVT